MDPSSTLFDSQPSPLLWPLSQPVCLTDWVDTRRTVICTGCNIVACALSKMARPSSFLHDFLRFLTQYSSIYALRLSFKIYSFFRFWSLKSKNKHFWTLTIFLSGQSSMTTQEISKILREFDLSKTELFFRINEVHVNFWASVEIYWTGKLSRIKFGPIFTLYGQKVKIKEI